MIWQQAISEVRRPRNTASQLWAELSEKINKDNKFATYLNLITKSVQEDERSTYLVQKLFKDKTAVPIPRRSHDSVVAVAE